MKNILIPADAFSHGQIKSKMWLAEIFSDWSEKHLDGSKPYELNWYGSWVGLGPFFLLSKASVNFFRANLFDLDQASLDSSKPILNYWHCEGLEVCLYPQDVNEVKPPALPYQLFVNTACEHMERMAWIQNIAGGAYVLLQSTDMKHAEHTNLALSLEDFKRQYGGFVDILESAEIKFSYPDKSFSRFMLFGKKVNNPD